MLFGYDFSKKIPILECYICANFHSQTPVLKIAFVIFTALIVLTFSCKKSNDHINTPPGVADTTKPLVVNVDTSTLLKSQIIYSYAYDVSGKLTSFDSSKYQWIYDDQRRVTQQTFAYVTRHNNANDSELDVTTYTYLNDRYIKSTGQYINGSLKGISNTAYYGPLGHTDSIVLSSGTVAYYYYNQKNLDSLEMHFNYIFGVPTLEDSIQYFYTGVNLDSIVYTGINEGPAGNFTDAYHFSEGNLISYLSYSNGVLTSVTNYTSTNILSKKMCAADPVYFGAPFDEKANYLISGSNSVVYYPTTTSSSSFTYQQDAANRIATLVSSQDGKVWQKQVFTYY